METLVALLAWVKANELLVVSLGFVISEALGAIPSIKANGFLSLVIIKVQEYFRAKGAVDLTPKR